MEQPRVVTGDDARRRLATLGTFFEVARLDAPDDWRPVDGLVAGAGLAERVAATTEALAAGHGGVVEHRVAASTASLGLVSRLLSPTLGAVVLGLPGPDPADLHWRAAGGSVELAAGRWGAADLAPLLAGPVRSLVEAVVDEHGLSEQVAVGNVTSAVHGALLVVASARPDLAPRCGAVLVSALDHPLLVGTADPGPPFVRRSCCLYYRLPGGGLCGDCVLRNR